MAKPLKSPPPWRSGFCNPSNPPDSHDRCPGAYQGRRCVCPHHAQTSTFTTPAIAPLTEDEARHLRGIIPPVTPEVPGLNVDDLAALRDHRGPTLANLAQAVTEQRALHERESDDPYPRGWVDALTWVLDQIIYREPTGS